MPHRALLRLLLAAGLAVSALSGCAMHMHAPFNPEDRDRDGRLVASPEAATAPLFAYDRTRVDFENHSVGVEAPEAYEVRRIELASVGDNGQPGHRVVGDYYRHREGEGQRLVIVLPIWGRDETYPARVISDGIVARLPDTNVFHMRGPNRLVDWQALRRIDDEAAFHAAFERFAERVRVNVIDIRRVIDWAEQQPEIDGDRIGLVGFSIGAVVGAIVVANEPRLRAGVLAMGALEPAEVLAHCAGHRGRTRDVVTERLGWSREEYRRALAEHLDELDAAVAGPAVDPERLLVFSALFDRCMPRHTQDALWERLGRPERVTYFAGHRTAFLSMTLVGFYSMNQRTYRFLDENL